jgi:DNA-binding NarL/FixJ family response regulator
VSTSVVIVDDQASFRQAARALLEADGFTVLGEAIDGESALAAIAALEPDVVLLDVRLPGASGPEVASALRARGAAAIVVLTSTVDYRFVVEACGAAAFIAKAHLSGATLRAAIEAA